MAQLYDQIPFLLPTQYGDKTVFISRYHPYEFSKAAEWFNSLGGGDFIPPGIKLEFQELSGVIKSQILCNLVVIITQILFLPRLNKWTELGTQVLQIHPQLLFPSQNKCGLYFTEPICNMKVAFKNEKGEKNWSISSIEHVCKNLSSWI